MKITANEIKKYLEIIDTQLITHPNVQHDVPVIFSLKDGHIEINKRISENNVHADVTITKGSTQPIFLTTYLIDQNNPNSINELSKAINVELRTLMFFRVACSLNNSTELSISYKKWETDGKSKTSPSYVVIDRLLNEYLSYNGEYIDIPTFII